MIQEHLEFLTINSPFLIGYTLKNNANGDKWKNIRVYLNGDETGILQDIVGSWTMICNGSIINLSGIETIQNQSIIIPGQSAIILYQE
jgi:pullulanase